MKTRPTSWKTPDKVIVTPPQAGATGCCSDMRQSMVDEAAYSHAQRRGFHGNADDRLNDWLEAEAEIARAPGVQPASSSPGDDGRTG
jgi:hypothetical protein